MKCLLRPSEFIDQLPDGYEYKLFAVGDEIRIAGAVEGKSAILFAIRNNKLMELPI